MNLFRKLKKQPQRQKQQQQEQHPPMPQLCEASTASSSASAELSLSPPPNSFEKETKQVGRSSKIGGDEQNKLNHQQQQYHQYQQQQQYQQQESKVMFKRVFTSLTAAVAAPHHAVEQKTLVCSDGMKLAIKQYRPAEVRHCRVLCLHGWMDNCESFHYMAPVLAAANHEVVALDFPGHGLSGHKPPEGPSALFAESAYYVKEAVESLGWSKSLKGYCLVGHSMGAAVAGLYSAMYPEEVKKLVLLEGAGPRSKPSSSVTKQIRTHIDKRRASNQVMFGKYSNNNNNNFRPTGPRIYPNLELAIHTRQQTARLSPGTQWLSQEAAKAMVERATKPAEAPPSDGSGTSSSSPSPSSSSSSPPIPPGAVQFRHDPRLQWPSIVYFTPEQVDAIYNGIKSPLCLLMADDGWPVDQGSLERVQEILKPAYYESLPGSHHFHADPDTAQAVCDRVLTFLGDCSEKVGEKYDDEGQPIGLGEF